MWPSSRRSFSGCSRGDLATGIIACLGALDVAVMDGAGSCYSHGPTAGTAAVTNTLGCGALAGLTGWWAVPIVVGVFTYLGVLGPIPEKVAFEPSPGRATAWPPS